MLKSFVAVSSMQNFSAAARELNTVQPAISRHISELEEELGVSLFWRNTRKVKITAAGRSLLRDALDILAREASAKEQAKRAAQGKIGQLRIGYFGSACSCFIPWLVQQYRIHYPEVQVSLREMTVQQQIDAFAAEQLDVGFSRSLPKSESKKFSVLEIYMDTLIAVIPETHEFATAENVRLRDLQADSFVLYKRSEAPGIFEQIINACHKEKFVPKISSQLSQMQTLLTAVAAGLGVSIMPGCVKSLCTNGCVFLPIQKQSLPVPIELHHRVDALSPTVEAFVQITEQVRQDIQRMFLESITNSPSNSKCSFGNSAWI